MLGAIKDEALRVALRAILDRSCARRREHLCGRGEGKPAARVELEKWTWREKKSRLIDNFVLAFCVAIRERRKPCGAVERRKKDLKMRTQVVVVEGNGQVA